MPLTPRFCSQCGTKVIARLIEGRTREVCPQCDTIFYRNPLPVAASVVLNDRREVLLVKRRGEPQKGMWCLPIGFAEMSETIAEAALRELKEETGIEGRILRLLDAESAQNDHYGDLLTVTFEIERTGGEERAGDDAEATAWFPLDRLPPLAFASNAKAVRICQEIHGEAWAIRESFENLDTEAGGALLSDPLVAFIHDRADDIARGWLADVTESPTTPSYRRLDAERLLKGVASVLSQFGRWLRGDEAEEEVREFYRILGKHRCQHDFQAHEVISSLMLLRKNIWSFARRQGILERPIDVYRVLELDRRLVLFFDRAMYHTLRGFEEQDRSE